MEGTSVGLALLLNGIVAAIGVAVYAITGLFDDIPGVTLVLGLTVGVGIGGAIGQADGYLISSGALGSAVGLILAAVFGEKKP